MYVTYIYIRYMYIIAKYVPQSQLTNNQRLRKYSPLFFAPLLTRMPIPTS